jgi:hypothetical protein
MEMVGRHNNRYLHKSQHNLTLNAICAINLPMAKQATRRKYFDPAHSVIMRFAEPERKLSQALDVVSKITGASRTRVYRWMRSRDEGGTGGLIPLRHAKKLFEYATKHGLLIEASEFLGGSRAA